MQHVTDFANLLNKPASDVKRPVTLPDGTYYDTVLGHALGLATARCRTAQSVILVRNSENFYEGDFVATGNTAILISEDNAMVLGAGLLFVILAAIMVVTRKVDWYRAVATSSSPTPGPDHGG